jgi:hypothetical protein
MKALKYVVAVATGLALVFVASPAEAWDNGTYLKTGDMFCTDKARSDTGARFLGHVTNGSAKATLYVSATADGPETLVWSQIGANIDFNKYAYGTAGTHYRGCVTITAHTVNTWGRSIIMGLGASTVGDIGPHSAILSPGGGACGDFGMGPVRLTGTASGAVAWSVSGTDLDYSFVGTIFSTSGSTVDATFTPGAEISIVEMCVRNPGTQPVSVSYELHQIS